MPPPLLNATQRAQKCQCPATVGIAAGSTCHMSKSWRNQVITCHTQLLLLLRAAVLCAAATQVQGDVDDGPLLLPSNAAAALPFCLGQALLPCLSIDCNWVASKTFGPTAPPAPASAPIASNLNIQTIALQSIKT